MRLIIPHKQLISVVPLAGNLFCCSTSIKVNKVRKVFRTVDTVLIFASY
jgi:hypothetical protein